MESVSFRRQKSFLEEILSRYAGSYDVARNTEENSPLVATADFHEHQSGYVLVRRAEMWCADRHEYAHFFCAENFNAEFFQECMDKTMKLADEKVQPGRGHMCSVVSAVFICEDADEAAVRLLQKYRYRKNFLLSLRGWMEVHTALVTLSDGKVYANAAGKNDKRFLDSLLKKVGVPAIISIIS